MKRLMMICMCVAAALATGGCGTTKSRSVEAQGMYVSETGQLAVGRVQVDAVPENVDSAIIHYAEDTALLSPSTKTHKIDVVLTGTNATANASSITEAICEAFVTVAPALAAADAAAPQGKTVLDTAEHHRAASKTELKSSEVEKLKSPSGLSTSQPFNLSTGEAPCPGGNCTPTAD